MEENLFLFRRFRLLDQAGKQRVLVGGERLIFGGQNFVGCNVERAADALDGLDAHVDLAALNVGVGAAGQTAELRGLALR